MHAYVNWMFKGKNCMQDISIAGSVFLFVLYSQQHLRFHRLSVDLLSQWQLREVERLAQSPESSPGFLKPLGLEVLSKEADLV